MPCPDAETIQAFVSGALPDGEREAILAHSHACVECHALIDTLRGSEGLADTFAVPPPPERELPPGTAVGRFVIKERLGGGAMGVVYAARDPELDRHVALKLLRAGAAGSQGSADARARIRREAQALARVSHPNVITVFDVGSFEGQVFIAMELVEGSTLRDWLAAERRAPSEILRVFLAAGRGLAAAHSVGVVHRDLKPDNVLIGRDGRVRVTDFGLARRVGAPSAATALDPSGPVPLEETLTQEGALVGTPAYMSPEQLAGRTADAASDEFSFCVALHEALWGERPFPGKTLPDLRAAISAGRRRAPPRDPRIRSAVRKAMLRGLALAPDARFPSMDALVDALRAAGRPRRWPAVAALAAAGLAVALAVGTTREEAAARASIAVLPFHNGAARADSEWLATALPEMLTSELAAGEKLRTVPTDTVRRARNELGADAANLAGKLGARYVVTGSYLPAGGGGVRVDLRLEDARGEVLFSYGETAREDALVDLVVRAGARVRAKLGVPDLSVDEVARARRSLPADPAAARPYVEGLSRWRERDVPGALPLLEEAVRRDPGFAPAQSLLAQVLWKLGYGDRARPVAEKARALAAGLGKEDRLLIEAEVAGVMEDGKAALAALEELVARFPDNPEYAIDLLGAQFAARRPEAALASLARLRAMGPPTSERIEIDRVEMFLAMSNNDFDTALRLAARLRDRGHAQGVMFLVTDGLFIEGETMWFQGGLARAATALEGAEVIDRSAGDAEGTAAEMRYLAWIRADQGRLRDARAGLEALAALDRDVGNTRNRYRNSIWIAEVMVRQGQLREAEILRDSLEFRYVGSSGAPGHAWIPYHRGDLDAALARAGDAVEVWRTQGDVYSWGRALAIRGTIRRARGEAFGAYADLQSALMLQLSRRQRLMAARTRLGLAELAIDRRDARAAEALIAAAVPAFEDERLETDLARAAALRARSLALRGDEAGARQAAAGARELAGRIEDVPVRLAVALAAAEVEHDGATAEQVRAHAEAQGFVLLAREAQRVVAARR